MYTYHCRYEDMCTDNLTDKCKTCIHNERTSYYEPIEGGEND